MSLPSTLEAGFASGYCGRVGSLQINASLVDAATNQYLYLQRNGNAADKLPARFICPGDYMALNNLQIMHNDDLIIYPEREARAIYLRFTIFINQFHFQKGLLPTSEAMFFRAFLSEDVYFQNDLDEVVVDRITVYHFENGKFGSRILLHISAINI